MKYDVDTKITTKITIGRETHTIAQWAEMYELHNATILSRYITGCRDYELLEPVYKDRLDEDFVHALWGGKWIYTGKKIIRKCYKHHLKWVYIGKNRGVDDD